MQQDADLLLEQFSDLIGQLLFLPQLDPNTVLQQYFSVQTVIDRHTVAHELTVQLLLLETTLSRVFHLNTGGTHESNVGDRSDVLKQRKRYR